VSTQPISVQKTAQSAESYHAVQVLIICMLQLES